MRAVVDGVFCNAEVKLPRRVFIGCRVCAVKMSPCSKGLSADIQVAHVVTEALVSDVEVVKRTSREKRT